MTQATYGIGDLASEYGVTLRTLRFYEDRGLLNPLRAGTLRVYTEDDKKRLALILHGKQLGFTLSEINELVARNASGLTLNATQVKAQICHLERQRETIDAALSDLRSKLSSLQET